MTAVSAAPVQVGKGIPADVPHAVSVSLPRWQDNVDYEEGRLADTMETGYPRFFIHRSIAKVSDSDETTDHKSTDFALIACCASFSQVCAPE